MHTEPTHPPHHPKKNTILVFLYVNMCFCVYLFVFVLVVTYAYMYVFMHVYMHVYLYFRYLHVYLCTGMHTVSCPSFLDKGFQLCHVCMWLLQKKISFSFFLFPFSFFLLIFSLFNFSFLFVVKEGVPVETSTLHLNDGESCGWKLFRRCIIS